MNNELFFISADEVIAMRTFTPFYISNADLL